MWTKFCFKSAITIMLATAVCASKAQAITPDDPGPAQMQFTVNVDATSVRSVMSPLRLGIHTSPYYYGAMNHALAAGRWKEAQI